MMEVRFAETADELDRIVALRYRILRAPWGKSPESARDDLEDTSHNAFIEANGEILACGRLQINADKTGQVRYMAVHEKYQGQKLGSLILKTLEKKAIQLGINTVTLHARENA